MIDKVGAVDRISFVMNGKPIIPKPVEICPEMQKPTGCQLHLSKCNYPKCNEPK